MRSFWLRIFVLFLLAITASSYRSRTLQSKITVLTAESGTALAPILTQRSICHVIAHINVQLASLAAHEGMQSGRGECHDRSTDQFVSHPLPWVDHHCYHTKQEVPWMYRSLHSCPLFAQGICPEQKLVEKICLIPQFVTFDEYQRIRASQCCIKDLVAFDDSLKILEQNQTRRKDPRVEVSSTVHLRQVDLNETGGKIYNLSTGGIGINTNCPVTRKERLTLAFHLPDTIGAVQAEGEVVWRQFHGDTPGHKKRLFTAGIRFLTLDETSRKAVNDYIRISNAPS